VTKTVTLDGRIVPYSIVRSERARLLRLKVGPDPEVTVVVPRGYRLGRVEDLLGRHREWIFGQLDRLAWLARQPRLTSGDRLPFLGRDLTLEIGTTRGRPRVSAVGDRLVVQTRDGRVADLLFRWYRDQAADRLSASVSTWSRAMEVAPRRITIRDQRTRWGSCSSLGNLNFSWRLVMAPPRVAEYVVVHELAHLLVTNHSREFWSLVERYCPDSKQHQKWLQENGDRLGQVMIVPD
jgi:predicted metal-dependent hydrolase